MLSVSATLLWLRMSPYVYIFKQLSKENQSNYDSDHENAYGFRKRLFVRMRGYDCL